MTGNQFRFVVLTVFAVVNIAAAWWWVPPSSGRGDVLLVSLLCTPTVVLAWWWSERLERPKGEWRTLGDFFAMPKVQRWSALGLIIVVGFAAWRLWTAPDARSPVDHRPAAVPAADIDLVDRSLARHRPARCGRARRGTAHRPRTRGTAGWRLNRAPESD